MSACPSSEVWTALPSTLSDEALAHLAGCASCRAEVHALLEAEQGAEALPKALRSRILSVVGRPSGRAPLWRYAAVAATLLLAVGLWRFSKEGGGAPTVPPGPPAPVALREPMPLPAPGGVWEAASEARAVLGRSVSAALEGGKLHWLPGEALALELVSGQVRLESPGESVRLRVGALQVALEDGEILAGLESGAPGAFAWIGSAWAGEEAVPFVRVLAGSAQVGGVDVSAGQEARLASDGTVRVVPTPAPGSSGWARLGEPGALKDASKVLAQAPAGDYRIEILVLKETPTAEAALGFEAAGQGFEMPLGSALPAGQGWTRLAVELRGGWCRVTAGSKTLVSCPAEQLGLRAYPVTRKGLALKAWGGELRFREARLRSSP